MCDDQNSENYVVELQEYGKNEIMCSIIERVEASAESNVKIHIYQGLPKADKMELIIQKSVELGVEKIIPVQMKRCVVKLPGKDGEKKRERWQKISEVAAKQCGRDVIPNVCEIKNVKEISDKFKEYDLVLLCYENEKVNSLKKELQKLQLEKANKEILKIAVIIGPEGGLESSEVEFMEQNGAKVISLGNRILRTETVALFVSSIIMYEFER